MLNNVASVVAQGSLLNFQGNLPPTVLFTPSQDGLFVLHYYSESASTSNALPQLSWTDDTGSKQLGFTNNMFSGLVGPASIPIRAKAGTSITLQTTEGRVLDNTSIYWSIEQVG